MVKCKLCGKNVEKLCKSHILSEFFYKPMYDEKHKFFKIPLQENEKNSFEQKGIREQLFCGQCETLISKYEYYVANLFIVFDKSYFECKKTELKEVDYVKMRKFQISILLRILLSKEDMYIVIENKDYHIERLKNILLKKEEIPPEQYGGFGALVFMNGQLAKTLIHTPEVIEDENNTYIRLIFGSIVWLLKITNNQDVYHDLYLNKEGTYVFCHKELSELGYIREMADRLDKQNKL